MDVSIHADCELTRLSPLTSHHDLSTPLLCAGDCSRFYSCHGSSCDETGVPVAVMMTIFALCISGLLIFPTLFKAVYVVYKMHKAGKFDTGATSQGLVYVILACLFSLPMPLFMWIRRMWACSSSGGTNDGVMVFTSLSTSFMGMSWINAIINVALLWIDVHLSSKKMQKMNADDSMVHKSKKVRDAVALKIPPSSD